MCGGLGCGIIPPRWWYEGLGMGGLMSDLPMIALTSRVGSHDRMDAYMLGMVRPKREASALETG
jgi:hypothetical protein